MNRSETANLLTSMASFDRRTIGESDVIAWQGVLADAAFDDCLEAVKRHYAENTEWMMPAHVRRIVWNIHGEREAAARSTGWAPGQAGVPRGEAMPEIGRGDAMDALIAGMPPELRVLLDKIAEERGLTPEDSRQALMPRRMAWEREHKAFLRTQSSEPNPLYKPQTANYYDTQATAGPSGEPSPVGEPPPCICSYKGMSGGHADHCPLATW